MSTPVLEFVGVHKTFKLGLRLKRVHAVRGVTLAVEPGEIFGYLGPNGAGKTTSIKMAMGLIGVTEGEVRLFGRPVGDRESRERIGFLPENPFFHDYLTAAELLSFAGELFGIPKKRRLARTDELLELVGLGDARARRLRTFSKGMLQRVGIAQALVNDPDLVVLDEPLSGLDPIGRKEVRDIIVSLRARGKTVFFSSHILHDVETICDRVAILRKGTIERLGPLRDLLVQGARTSIVTEEVGSDLEGALAELGRVERLGAAVRISTDDARVAEVLGRLLGAGCRVTHVTPERESLEELFMREAGGAGRATLE